MVCLSDSYLHKVAYHIFKGAGVPPEEAHIVADHLVAANLAGHDSHGVIRISSYIERIRKGQLKPGAAIRVQAESPTTARIDGNWGFGYVVSTRAVEMAIRKARTNNVAALSILHQGHVGRLTDYTVALAQEGMIGLMATDSGRTSKKVVPFGGRVPCLGTNPVSIAIPSNQKGPVFIDFATSMVAAGKIDVAKSRGEQVPAGWLIDSDGKSTTDPNNFFGILPLGGHQGHKGYGLSFMVEIFAGLLTGIGFGVDPSGWHNDGALMIAIKVDAFRPLEEFKRDVDDFISLVKSTPPAPGFQEVLYPGEPEWRTSEKRAREGIFIEDGTWEALRSLMEDLGITDKVGRP
ncbi:MAG: Ldh family oxidoreductase [Deltaproteobacteria bacterium]|nr:Ldh family oxidoreductase [Deltaproteobacteria bacterium]